LSEKPKRTKSKTSSKETVIVKTEDAKEDDIAEPMKVEIIPMNEIQGFQIVPIFQMVPILNPSMIQSSSGTSGFANLQILNESPDSADVKIESEQDQIATFEEK